MPMPSGAAGAVDEKKRCGAEFDSDRREGEGRRHGDMRSTDTIT